jgi:2-keto-3-deoxy-galactonokinase
MINTTRTNLIVADSLFVLVFGMEYETDGLKNYPYILIPLTAAALATCIIRHINYYHMTKRIF